jgi:hypothetical protein
MVEAASGRKFNGVLMRIPRFAGGRKSLVFPAFIAFREYFPPAELDDFELFLAFLVRQRPFSRGFKGFFGRLLPFCHSRFFLSFPLQLTETLRL